MVSAIPINAERTVKGVRYLASNNPDLVSLKFVTDIYTNDASYWTKPMDLATVTLMVQSSSIIGVYRRHESASGSIEMEQVAMARLITDFATHVYLTDV